MIWVEFLLLFGFFFHKRLPLTAEERSFKMPAQGMTSWSPQSRLTLCFCPAWDLCPLRPPVLQAGPIPRTFAKLKPV